MGNLSWTIVAGLVLVVSYSLFASNKTNEQTSSVQSEYQEQVLAREAARSGYKVALHKLRTNYESYRVVDHKVSLNNAIYKISVSGPPAGPVSVSVSGSLVDAEHKISAAVERVHSFPDAISIDGGIDEVTAGGTYTITGLDTDPDVLTPGSGGNIGTHAIKTNDPTTAALLRAQLDSARVFGVEGNGDIAFEVLELDMDTLIAEVANKNSLVSFSADKNFSSQTIGSAGAPALIEVNGNAELNGSTHGCGVLVVHGDLVMNDNAHWEGIVIARGGNNVELLGSSSIVGGLMISMEGGSGTADGIDGSCEAGYGDHDDDDGDGDDDDNWEGNDDDDGYGDDDDGGYPIDCPPGSGINEDDDGDGDDDDGYEGNNGDDDDGDGDDDDGLSGNGGSSDGDDSGETISHRRFVVQDNAKVLFSWEAYRRCGGSLNAIKVPGILVTSVKEVDL